MSTKLLCAAIAFTHGLLISELSQDQIPNYALNLKEYERKLEHLANSNRPELRIAATDYIGAKLRAKSELEILWSLLHDSDNEVKGNAALAVAAISLDDKWSDKDAARFAKFLKMQLSKERLARFGTSSSNESENWLTSCQALGLNALYFGRPLISVNAYYSWQDEVMLSLVTRMTLDRKVISERSNGLLLALFAQLTSLPSIFRALEYICDGLEDLPAETIEQTIRVLWRHQLAGEERPLHRDLSRILRSRLASHKEGILAAIKDHYLKERLAAAFEKPD